MGRVLTRTLLLVLLAMVMFAAGLFVLLGSDDEDERVLGGVAVLGALVIVIGHLGNGNGKE